jgi:hypothetical protein
MVDLPQLTLQTHRSISVALDPILLTSLTFSSIHSQRMRSISLLLSVLILSLSLPFHPTSIHCLRRSYSSNRLHFQQTILSKAGEQPQDFPSSRSIPSTHTHRTSTSRLSLRCSSNNYSSSNSNNSNNRTSTDTSRLHQGNIFFIVELHPSCQFALE